MSKLERAVQDWFATAEGDGLNAKLIGIASAVYKEKPECRNADAIENYLLDMGARRWGNLDDRYKKDCRRAAERSVKSLSEYAYKEEKIRRTTNEKKADYTKDRENWYELNGRETDFLKKVKEQDLREDRITTRTAVKALFANANGHVWHGASEASIEEKNWIETSELSSLPNGSNYISTSVFGDKLKSGEASEHPVYERTNDNVSKVVFVVMEMDAPMTGKSYGKEEFRDLPEEEKKKYRSTILKDTCLILESAGLFPTTITFSGNKSYHCAFRFRTPVEIIAWHSRIKELTDSFKIIGADPAMLSLMRCTRMPTGSTRLVAEQDNSQRLVYFDAEAEYDFNDFVDKMKAFTEKISDVKNDMDDIHCPVFQNDKGKWMKNCVEWRDFIEKAGVSKIDKDKKQELIVSDERGLYDEKTPQQMSDYLVNYVYKNKGKVVGAHFVDLYCTQLSKSSMELYSGIVRNLNEPQDSFNAVYAPFKNGMVTITKEGIDIVPDFMGRDIRRDCPTLSRDFEIDMTKGEFETFLERACGSEEGNPEWKEREKSLCSLIGYMVCRKKESVNYINYLTEETEAEDNGRTGKGIIAGSIKYWRRRCFVDGKNCNEDSMRFIFSGYKDSDEYLQIDDASKNFDMTRLYPASTDGFEVEKKGENRRIIPLDKAPKIIMTANFMIKANGGSQEGRVRIFEISNHYNSNHTPYDEFGHRLFDEWDDDEWKRFDTFVARCVMFYLVKGYYPCPHKNMDYKQWLVTIPEYLRNWFTDENGLFSVLPKEIWASDFKKEFDDWHYKKYHQNSPYSFPPSQTISRYVKLHCDVFNIGHESQKIRKNQKTVWKFFELSQLNDCDSNTSETCSNRSNQFLSNSLDDDGGTENSSKNDENRSDVTDTFQSESKRPEHMETAETQHIENPCSNVPIYSPSFNKEKEKTLYIKEYTNNNRGMGEEEVEQARLQSDEGYKNVQEQSELYAQNEKNGMEQDDFFSKAPDAPHTVVDHDKQIYEIHFKGKMPKPDEQMFSPNGTTDIYKVDGYDIQIKDGKPLGRWKVIVDEV